MRFFIFTPLFFNAFFVRRITTTNTNHRSLQISKKMLGYFSGTRIFRFDFNKNITKLC